MSPAAVHATHLGKAFRLYNKPFDRLVEWMSLGRLCRHSKFQALQDIDFIVHQGECVGLIGSNGAGKSTLLRILSGTLAPDGGSVSVQGRVLCLLELGTGFNPELTGRQNVLHTAQLLGLPEHYAESKLVDIEQFADLGDFFDRPIKTYSTGMTLRVAFSMFAFFEPDVLIIDEALAVGDAAFQRKCYRRMEELIGDSHRAVILVSHDLQSIVKLCNRVYWLDHGKVRQSGDPAIVAQEYLRETFSNDRSSLPAPIPAPVLSLLSEPDPVSQSKQPPAIIPTAGLLVRSSAAIVYPSAGVELLGLWLENNQSQSGATMPVDEPFTICYALRFRKFIDGPVIGIRLATTRGDCLIATNTQVMGITNEAFVAGQTVVIRWPILPGLGVGDYFISCGCSLKDDVYQFVMREVDAYQFSIVGARRQGGLCSLNGMPIIASSR